MDSSLVEQALEQAGTVMMLRGLERILILVAAVTSILCGVHLYRIGVLDKSSADGSGGGIKLAVKDWGPGLFFAFFGAVIIGILAWYPAVYKVSLPGLGTLELGNDSELVPPSDATSQLLREIAATNASTSEEDWDRIRAKAEAQRNNSSDSATVSLQYSGRTSLIRGYLERVSTAEFSADNLEYRESLASEAKNILVGEGG